MIDPRALPADISLRDLREGDEVALAAAYVRNRAHLEPWDPARSEDFYTVALHHTDVRRQIATREAGSTYPVVLTRGDEIVGRSAITGIARGVFQSASLGYWVDERLTGRGVATALVGEMVAIARDTLSLHRLEAGTLLHNVASQRVLERNGFERIGVAKRYLLIAGEWQDHVLFQRILG
ncbi:GNAT family N-acetyltransferase [Mycetocola tolaasinivorans]|uniref:GNAT family N-acetyltransferase n=1 Tax=Mycetocola tolaasinivorans TaxID=76635 RepID=UPI001FEA1619|nr:GNAT family protein [Mycetocola tolaasinivorans]